LVFVKKRVMHQPELYLMKKGHPRAERAGGPSMAAEKEFSAVPNTENGAKRAKNV